MPEVTTREREILAELQEAEQYGDRVLGFQLSLALFEEWLQQITARKPAA